MQCFVFHVLLDLSAAFDTGDHKVNLVTPTHLLPICSTEFHKAPSMDQSSFLSTLSLTLIYLLCSLRFSSIH